MDTHRPVSPPAASAGAAEQLAKLQKLLAAVVPTNRFYSRKFAAAGVSPEIETLDEFKRSFPFTFKEELIEDQLVTPPYGSNLTFPLDKYTRFNQTSATTGIPLRWLDTPESWSWMLDNWEIVYRAAGVKPGEGIFFAFSFGPFLGFWTAFESAVRMRCLVIPGGGLSSVGRLKSLLDNRCSVLCCTPTYAIRLGEVAREENLELEGSQIKTIIVAGEPGGSIPSVYQRIEALWPGARVFDHHGMTEVGPVSFECPEKRGVLKIIDSAYIAEVIDPQNDRPVAEGETGELVLTTLGRTGSPLIRYRTGDLVRAVTETCNGSPGTVLEGGILGRVDDMISIRGVNVYPGAVEEIVRSFEEILEYRVEVRRERGMGELKILVETTPDCRDHELLKERLQNALRASLSLRIPVSLVSNGTLPRFEMKARRWIRV